jgi:hypothetical protein
MAVRIIGTTNQQEVDSNLAARTSLYDANSNPIIAVDGSAVPSAGAGSIVVSGVDHDIIRSLDVDKLGRMEIPFRRLLINEQCEGATLNSQRWTTTATTMTAAQTATGITLNASAITTTTTGVLLTSRQQLMRFPTAGLMTRIRARSTLVANQAAEMGFGFQAALSATAATVDNGAFWRINTDGTVVPVLAYNSTEVTGTNIAGSISSANYYDYYVHLEDDRANFIVTRSDTGAVVSNQVLRVAITGPKLWSVTHVYEYLRCRNNTAPASAGQLIVGDLDAYQLDSHHGESWGSQLSRNNQNAYLSPTAFTQLQQWANSAAPASATLSNTAAGYTTLGGLYQWAAVASAVTDYCLFGFTVPAPYRLCVTGLHISMLNTGAANAATPATSCIWGLGANGASANLSTGGHIRRVVGCTAIAASAPIGAASPDLDVTYPEPMVSEPGTTFAVIMRIIGGAATASQVITGHVDVRGYFE